MLLYFRHWRKDWHQSYQGEASGIMASPEYKRKVYDEDWYLGETFDAAIGQSLP